MVLEMQMAHDSSLYIGDHFLIGHRYVKYRAPYLGQTIDIEMLSYSVHMGRKSPKSPHKKVLGNVLVGSLWKMHTSSA